MLTALLREADDYKRPRYRHLRVILSAAIVIIELGEADLNAVNLMK